MGKNKQPKDEAPNPNSVVNREMFQRLNFLYQASAYLKGIEASASVPSDGTHINHTSRDSPRKKGCKRRRATLGGLGSSYVQCMRNISSKNVIRIDPNVKRTLCKGCDTVLLPGTTASVRVRGSADKSREVVYTCLACHTPRIIPASPAAPSPVLVPSSVSPMTVAPTALHPTTLEALEVSTSSQAPPARSNKRQRSAPRPSPLFSRLDAGHVVFRGNEALPEE
ncbi:RNAse P Rpr2/Rpp21/SNM1 subunit domain-containing protein [Gautieria morchelliformis]|nr:RNAse P Rpr2/Rpp21/SNM1 subunit domain-containing protein [Gautieria morchelliformis]